VSDGRLHYARNGDIRLAYQIFGEAEPTLVWVPHVLTNINYYEDPENPFGAFVHMLTPHMRVLVSDGRGTGLSDPVTRAPTLQERVDDVLAVFDAAKVDTAIVNAASFAGPVGIAFAASHPERVTSLTLNVTAARFLQDPPNHPWGFTPEDIDRQIDEIDAHWGEGALIELANPSIAELPGAREQFGRFQRSVMSPSTAKMQWRAMMGYDVRDMLSSVQCPVLVTARPGDKTVPFEASAALAADLPTA
jgi:pimeloyl-ACP methyl ester carboxylesterase